MLFSDHPRTHYRNAPAHEVICQLRFPSILTINTVEPADFQEAIRAEFPQYARRQDAAPPRITGLGGPNPKVEQQSTLRYPGWEEFALHLDKPLAAFIRLYKPAYFLRVGLRYVNVFSRSRLGLEGVRWSELFAPAYTAPMQDTSIAEDRFLNCGCDLTLKLDSSCRAKIHAGPGVVKRNAPGAPQDPEVKFLFDMDLSMNGNTPCTLAAGALETLHGHSTRLFEGAITDRLRDAMDAE